MFFIDNIVDVYFINFIQKNVTLKSFPIISMSCNEIKFFSPLTNEILTFTTVQWFVKNLSGHSGVTC